MAGSLVRACIVMSPTLAAPVGSTDRGSWMCSKLYTNSNDDPLPDHNPCTMPTNYIGGCVSHLPSYIAYLLILTMLQRAHIFILYQTLCISTTHPHQVPPCIPNPPHQALPSIPTLDLQLVQTGSRSPEGLPSATHTHTHTWQLM